MQSTLLSIVLASQLGSPLGPPALILVADKVPTFNVEAMCTQVLADNKASGLALPQTFDDCISDENTARQQLAGLWVANSGPVRESCEGEATAGGISSYVDMLTCVQMTDWAKSPSSPEKTLRGASKKRPN